MTFAKYCRLILEVEYGYQRVAEMVASFRGSWSYAAVSAALEKEHGKPTDPATMTEGEKIAQLKKYKKVEDELRREHKGKYTQEEFFATHPHCKAIMDSLRAVRA